MLRYLYADQLVNEPILRDTMFKDRAAQFKQRLGWEVTVNDQGEERDPYDDINPLYVIWQRPDGTHGGSMRFLPTTGQTMVSDHFLDLTDGVRIESPLIWECTRFCLCPNAGPQVSAALMLGGAEVGINFYLTHAVGVFDRRMVRVYRALGWGPTIVGTSGNGADAISVGLWEFSGEIRRNLCQKAGILPATSRYWFDKDFSQAATQSRIT
jgi:acyl homoserine lactone synthase